MNKYFLFTLLFAGFILSCNDDGKLSTPNNDYSSNQNASIYTVEIDGTLRNFSKVTEAVSSLGLSEINGINEYGQSISLSIPQGLSTGTYSETNGAEIEIIIANQIYTNIDENGDYLPLVIQITSVNNTSGLVSGVFFGEVMNLSTGELKTLTNGIFSKIHFQPSDFLGGILRAKFNDTLFDFSMNAKAEGAITTAIISGTNINQLQSLSITIPNGITVGTFTEEDFLVIKVNLGTSNNPNDVYSNFDAASETYLPVSLTITSINLPEDSESGGNVTGYFSGDITKFTSGLPGEIIEITDGEISVPIEMP